MANTDPEEKKQKSTEEEGAEIKDFPTEGEIEIRDEAKQLEELSKLYGVPHINLDDCEITAEVSGIINREYALKHKLIPVTLSGNLMKIAMLDPSDIYVIDDLRFSTGHDVEVFIAPDTAIKRAIDKFYGTPEELEQLDVEKKEQEAKEQVDRMIGDIDEFDVDFGIAEEELNLEDDQASYEDAPIIKLVNYMLTDAINKGASDIHIEPYEDKLRIRYRVDGVLHDVLQPPHRVKRAVSSRVKIMANLDIAERRLPQDGRIKLRVGKKSIEYRVSSVPTVFGEKVVLRILDKGALQLDLTKLGFEEKQLAVFKKAIHRPYGMVLITGPTGSGKTTTLYSSLVDLNNDEVNISTVEDPVEYSLSGVNQVKVHEDIGLTFASCMRSFLRQDPDIILIGEIRDYETAEIAVKAALTGHLVLSTLHTNDSASTIARLLNIGIEPFLVTSSLNAIVAQRLIRVICDDCKKELEVLPQTLIDLEVPAEEVDGFTVYGGEGCDKCSGTGYKGRAAIYEVMFLSDTLKEFILNGATTAEIKREAIQQGMKTLRQSALEKLKQGVTTIEEVIKISASDSN